MSYMRPCSLAVDPLDVQAVTGYTVDRGAVSNEYGSETAQARTSTVRSRADEPLVRFGAAEDRAEAPCA